MERKIKIWQTAKDSFGFVFHDFKSWVKLALAPLIIMISSTLIAMTMMGSTASMISPGAGQVNAMMETGFGGTIVLLIGMIIAWLMFATNAYRYVMYNEGGVKWMEFRLDHHMGRLFLFSLAVMFILGVAGGVGVGIVVLSLSLGMGWFSGVLGFFVTLAIIYLMTRLAFALPFAAGGMEHPIKYSFELSRGYVLRLIGLFMAVGFFSLLFMLASMLVFSLLSLLFMLVGMLVSILFGVFGFLEVSTLMIMPSIGLLGTILFQLALYLFLQAVGLTAIVKAYQAIAEK